MSRIAAIGDEARLVGYGLAGVEVHGAADEPAARAAWESLRDGVACLILTEEARTALGPALSERPGMIWAVVPD